MRKITLGSQVEKLRKRLGFSQELLAEETGLNLRTIQRIENNETVPRADSLKRITDALKVTPDELIDYSLVEDKTYLKILNISALSFLFFPLLGIILPLIFWIMKRDKIKDVDFIGKKIMNFQITWIIVLFTYYLLLILPVFFSFQIFSWNGDISMPNLFFGSNGDVSMSNVMLPIYFTFLLYGINILFILINAVLIYSNKKNFYKPAFRFLK